MLREEWYCKFRFYIYRFEESDENWVYVVDKGIMESD